MMTAGHNISRFNPHKVIKKSYKKKDNRKTIPTLFVFSNYHVWRSPHSKVAVAMEDEQG